MGCWAQHIIHRNRHTCTIIIHWTFIDIINSNDFTRVLREVVSKVKFGVYWPYQEHLIPVYIIWSVQLEKLIVVERRMEPLDYLSLMANMCKIVVCVPPNCGTYICLSMYHNTPITQLHTCISLYLYCILIISFYVII